MRFTELVHEYIPTGRRNVCRPRRWTDPHTKKWNKPETLFVIRMMMMTSNKKVRIAQSAQCRGYGLDDTEFDFRKGTENCSLLQNAKTICGAHTPTFKWTVGHSGWCELTRAWSWVLFICWSYGRVEVYLHSLMHLHGVQRDFTHFTASDKYLNHNLYEYKISV